MNDFDGTPALHVVKEWFLEEETLESFDEDVELILLESLPIPSGIDKARKLRKE